MNEWKLRNDVGCWDIQHPPQASFSSSPAAAVFPLSAFPRVPGSGRGLPSGHPRPHTRKLMVLSGRLATGRGLAGICWGEEWGGQPGILARLEAAATVTVPGERSVWRRGGRTPEHGGGETSSSRGKAVQNYPWAFGKHSLGSDQWLLPIFRWKNIPFKSDVYWVQKSLSNGLLFTVFWFSLGQILVLATYMPWL